MLVGRDEERLRIDAVLDAARMGRCSTVLVAGEAGIGKTSLLDYAGAQADGLRVVRATGVRAEAGVPFAGLLALTRPVRPYLDDLPAPQAEALRVALAERAPTGPSPRSGAPRGTPGDESPWPAFAGRVPGAQRRTSPGGTPRRTPCRDGRRAPPR